MAEVPVGFDPNFFSFFGSDTFSFVGAALCALILNPRPSPGNAEGFVLQLQARFLTILFYPRLLILLWLLHESLCRIHSRAYGFLPTVSLICYSGVQEKKRRRRTIRKPPHHTIPRPASTFSISSTTNISAFHNVTTAGIVASGHDQYRVKDLTCTAVMRRR